MAAREASNYCMASSRWTRTAVAARIGAGPLALAGFFLPWTHGPGVLSGVRFSGFGLVRFAGRLQALDLDPAHELLRWAVRLSIVGVAVAAAWLIALAPRYPHHRLYALSGWYLTAFVAAAFAIGLWRGGLTAPASGLALLAVASLLFLAGEASKVR